MSDPLECDECGKTLPGHFANCSIEVHRQMNVCPDCGVDNELYFSLAEKANLKWSDKWPNKPGAYWFFGVRAVMGRAQDPKLHLVKAWSAADKSVSYVADGQFMYKSEGGYGLWTQAELPERPFEEFERLKQLKETIE